MSPLKATIKRIPIVGALATKVHVALQARRFTGSNEYWKQRYERGDNSGDGSYDKLAEFKAEVVNGFVEEHAIQSVIEYGCGDGNQLSLARYPRYLGFDISPDALNRCRERFKGDPTKSFKLMDEYADERADLVLSLDVIYHLVEDEVFESHMRSLFDSASRFLIVYSSNRDTQDADQAPHVRHREFSRFIDDNAESLRLLRHIPNRHPYTGDTHEGSFADFFVYQRD